MWFLRFLGAYAVVSVIRLLLPPLIWIAAVAGVAAAPAVLWTGYVDPHPAPELMVAFTVATLAIIVSAITTYLIRRWVRRRRLDRAVAYLLDMADRAGRP